MFQPQPRPRLDGNRTLNRTWPVTEFSTVNKANPTITQIHPGKEQTHIAQFTIWMKARRIVFVARAFDTEGYESENSNRG